MARSPCRRSPIALGEDRTTLARTLPALVADLVYGRLRPDAEEKKPRLRDDGTAVVVTWDRLLEDAERFHREFLDIVKARAPEDDPRSANSCLKKALLRKRRSRRMPEGSVGKRHAVGAA